jgi:uncharacterized protein (DUF1697 family)
MVYVALLRGINVGGKNTVGMAQLKQTFRNFGFEDVKTYINSGNIIFSSSRKPSAEHIEAAIQKDFGFHVPVVLRSFQEIALLVSGIPPQWVNDSAMRCDVLFLWPAVDNPDITQRIPHKPEIEDVLYLPGSVIWRIDRDNVRRGAVPNIIGSDTYRQMTIRNITTVRKLYELMKAI